MVGASKILTVSYGTFSCTLEGFDDSFGTMKAIAEYFRDLAADDRYFGAEPPTPDADMLQRIAEREIRRRVDAHVDGEKVVLRADAGADTVPEPTALRAPDPTPEPAPEPQAPAAPAPVAAEPELEPAPQPAPLADPEPEPELHAEPEAPAPVSDPAPAAPAASDEDSVAAKLARIRAVVQTARSAPAEEEEGDSSFIEDEHAAAPASAPEAQPADLPVDEIEDAVEVAEDLTETDETPVEEEVTAEIEEPVEDVLEDAAEEIDEIEAAADADIDEDIQDDYAEDTAEDDQPLDISALAARLSAEKEALRAEAESEVEPEAEEIEEPVEVAFDEAPQDEIAEETADFTEQEMLEEIQEVPEENPVVILDEAAPEEVAEADAEETEEVDPAQARRAERRARRAARRAQQERQPRNEGDARDAAARARARVMKVKRDELEDMRASLIESDLIPGAKADAEDAPKAEAVPVAEDAPTEEPARIRPLRVLKRVRKDVEPEVEPQAEPEAAIEADLQDEITDDLDDTPIMADAEDDLDGDDLDGDDALGLSPEDEADLMAELAEVERDTAPATPVAPAEDTKAKAPAGGVTDVSRLVDEVNTKMEGTEHKRRRSAIAHLKAAVAATVAERGLGRNRDRETEDEVQRTPYRADLSAVVRPAAKPEAKAKMPPLMLVSEQRIDRPTAQTAQRSAGNLALRAVENDTLDDDDQDDVADQGNIFADDDTFADFAERHGAHALPDILECAAAYLARVEGQDSFTRPEVMNTVAEFMGADKFQREDGLRAFGQLLREGPLERQGRGAFTIAATSRFMSA